MQKLILVSILLATVLLPTLAARDRSAVRGLKRTLWAVFWFDAFYLFAVLVIAPRL